MGSLFRGFFYLSSFLPTTWNAAPSQNNNGERIIDGKTFDYVVVGGGLTGLVIANRLSENKDRE
jgi:hypothetical protein